MVYKCTQKAIDRCIRVSNLLKILFEEFANSFNGFVLLIEALRPTSVFH